MNLKKTLSTALLTVTGCSVAALAQEHAKAPFQVCKSTYALCTFAKCQEIKILGTPLLFSCGCEVKTDEWSVGAQPCEPVEKTPEGQSVIRSRYHPIKTYARCSNSRPWAMCLDSPCVIDKNDKTKAQCTCPPVQDQGDYLVAPGTDACTAGIVSSATVVDLDTITDFLEIQDKLVPSDFTVVNAKHK
ncbi:MAG: hypothetical protein WCC92_15690 [Candidatus Korobacteraceae bacterium]